MMPYPNRRRQSVELVSFFSFQDALMGFLGVMLLILLMLAITPMELKTSTQTAATTIPIDRQINYDDLKDEVDILDRRLAGFRMIADLDREGMERRADLLRLRQEQIDASEAKAIEELSSEISPNDIQQIQKHRALLRERDQIIEQIEKLQRNPNLTFIIDDQLGHDGLPTYLIQVDKDAIYIGESVSDPNFKWRTGTDSARLKWIRTVLVSLNVKSNHFVILVKPSGWELGQAIYDLIGEMGGRHRGMDFVKENINAFDIP